MRRTDIPRRRLIERNTTMTTKTKAEWDRDAEIAQFTDACERFARRLRGMKMTLTMIKMEPTDLVAIGQEFLDSLGVTVDDLRRAQPPRKVPRLDADLAPDQTRH
jgi:hypothetical protein